MCEDAMISNSLLLLPNQVNIARAERTVVVIQAGNMLLASVAPDWQRLRHYNIHSLTTEVCMVPYSLSYMRNHTAHQEHVSCAYVFHNMRNGCPLTFEKCTDLVIFPQPCVLNEKS
jgi:hypothetical protein